MPQQPSGSLFRPILPSSRGSRATQEPPLPQRRQPVIAACEACRKRKVKCDAIRPRCSSCASRETYCQYTTQPAESRFSALRRSKAHAEQQLREIHESHEVLLQLVHALISHEDADAATILEQLRYGTDPAFIVQRLEAGELMQRRRQGAFTTGQASEHPSQDLQSQPRADALPPIAQWFSEDREAYEELFRYLKSVRQEEGVDVLRRIRHGQSISDILHLVKEGNLLLQMVKGVDTC